MTDPLEVLLHRCHRDELLVLAPKVGVNPMGLGLGSLARAVADAVSHKGSHLLESIALRGGKGRPYADIVTALARSQGLKPTSLEDMERDLVKKKLERRWSDMSPEQRTATWSSLGLEGPAPTQGEVAVHEANVALGPRFLYRTLLSFARHAQPIAPVGVFLLGGPLGCFLRPFLPFVLPVIAWRALRPSEAEVLDVVLEVARIRQLVLHRMTIGIVGSPSSGKDAAIRALFGLDTGNISPIAGSTKQVAVLRFPEVPALYLVNTPGLGDVAEQISEETRQILDHIDIYLYVINAEGGVQARELADYRKCRETGKPVLAVMNKIDVLRPSERERYLEDARSKLGTTDGDFAAVAFDPLPELAPAPLYVDAVKSWVLERLTEAGKPVDILPKPGQ